MNKINEHLSLNPLFAQAKASRIKLNLFLTILLYFFLWLSGLVIGRFIFSITAYILSHTFVMDECLFGVLRKLIVCGIQILLFIAWVRMIEKRPIKAIGLQARKPVKSYTVGLISGFCAITVITAILYIFGMVTIEAYHVTEVIPIIIPIAAGWFVQSASEEIAIRGWLIPSLSHRSSPVVSIVLTAIIFGIIHLFSSGVTALSFINLIFSGVFFAGYAIFAKNIWGNCGLHFAWNFTLGNIYGFPVSGFSSNGQSLISMKQAGPNFFTGGAFGPEGGCITTLLLLLGIGILAINFYKKSVSSSDHYQK